MWYSIVKSKAPSGGGVDSGGDDKGDDAPPGDEPPEVKAVSFSYSGRFLYVAYKCEGKIQ
jgi:hypothetical protein